MGMSEAQCLHFLDPVLRTGVRRVLVNFRRCILFSSEILQLLCGLTLENLAGALYGMWRYECLMYIYVHTHTHTWGLAGTREDITSPGARVIGSSESLITDIGY